MKRFLYNIIGVCVGLLALASCHHDDELGLPGKELTHTVIFYMAGENTLGSFLASDSLEIAQAAESLPSDVRVVMYIDDAKSSRVCVKAKNKPMQLFKTYEHNVCSTDSAEMLQVLTDIVLTFPSKTYGLVGWSHATGWLFDGSQPSAVAAVRHAPTPPDTSHSVRRKSFGVDNGLRSYRTDSGRQLDIPALAGVLRQLPRFEYVMFDACFMQCIEVAYELRDACRWVISSPAEIPGSGAPYASVLPLLCADPFNAEAVIDAYHRYYDSGAGYSDYRGVILSAISTAGLERFAEACRPYVLKIWGEGREADVSEVQYYTRRRIYPYFYDMESLFCHNLSADDYAQWRQSLAGVVPYCRLSDQWTYANSAFDYGYYRLYDREHCTGVSMYSPTAARSETMNVQYRRLQWYHAVGLDQTGW